MGNPRNFGGGGAQIKKRQPNATPNFLDEEEEEEEEEECAKSIERDAQFLEKEDPRTNTALWMD